MDPDSNVDDCFDDLKNGIFPFFKTFALRIERANDRKLRKIRPDLLKSKQSIKAAEEKYKEAYEIGSAGFPKMAVVLAYASKFHAGRALLYMDGIQEKSHYCLVQYLKENYVWNGKLDQELITTMDHFRGERNDVFYGFSPPNINDEEAKNGMEIARKMIDKIKDLIEHKKSDEGDE